MIFTVLFIVLTTASADAQYGYQPLPQQQNPQPEYQLIYSSRPIDAGIPQDVPNLQPHDESALYDIQDRNTNSLSDDRHILFDIALLKELAKQKENVLVSPLSIKTTLAMVMEGSKGICATEIQSALRIGNLDTARYYLKNILETLKNTKFVESANAVFVPKTAQVNPEFQRKLEDYKGIINKLNFKNVQQSVNTINEWVRAQTHGFIDSIISPDQIQKDFTVVLANALYFKGKWEKPFDKGLTGPGDFFTEESANPVKVDMMRSNNMYNYAYLPKLHAEAVDIPYESGFSMLILMPLDKNSVENLATDLSEPFEIIEKELKPTELSLFIPKFEMDYHKNMVEVLKTLRVKTIFSREANLTGIVPNENVLVNNVVHKTKIRVDEEGTVAAAATGVQVVPLMSSVNKKVTINKPFIYFIYHRQSKAIIFEGIYRQPKPSSSSFGNGFKRTYLRNNFQ